MGWKICRERNLVHASGKERSTPCYPEDLSFMNCEFLPLVAMVDAKPYIWFISRPMARGMYAWHGRMIT